MPSVGGGHLVAAETLPPTPRADDPSEEDFPAEHNGDGPEDEQVEKYPRVGQDVERILQEISDVHGQG